MEEKRECGDSVRVAGFPEPRVLSSALDSGIRRNDGSGEFRARRGFSTVPECGIMRSRHSIIRR